MVGFDATSVLLELSKSFSDAAYTNRHPKHIISISKQVYTNNKYRDVCNSTAKLGALSLKSFDGAAKETFSTWEMTMENSLKYRCEEGECTEYIGKPVNTTNGLME